MIKPLAIFNVCAELARTCERELTADDISVIMRRVHEVDDENIGQYIRTALLSIWGMTEADVVHIRRSRSAAKEKKQYLAKMAEQFDEMVLKGLVKPKDRDVFIESLKGNRVIEI